jgi:cation diffusion facilitator family transporter
MAFPKTDLARTARLTRAVTTLSVATASVLTGVKVVVWLATGSIAVMASAADSALDLVASAATFLAVRYAAAPPDAEHRFGHGKAEAFASLLQAGLVFASGALVGQEAVRHLVRKPPLQHETWALGAMALSILLTAALVAAQTRMLRAGRSVAISADRTHYITDLASNAVALIGVAGASFLNLPVLDALSGLVITAILLWGATSVFRDSADQLMDRELSDEARARITRLARHDPLITDVHQLRTRASGPIVHIQMHAALDPDLSLVEAHRVVVAAERRILEAFPSADILIHPDPFGRSEPHGGAFAETYEASLED